MGFNLKDLFKTQMDAVPSQPTKRFFDPKNPISSLTSGSQQFTIVADTNHGNGSIIEKIAAEMPNIAKSGVKHLMLEYEEMPSYRELLDRVNSRPPKITEKEIMDRAENFKSVYESSSTNITGVAYAHLLAAAMKNNIKVHFAGDPAGWEERFKKDELNQEREIYLAKHPKLERFAQTWLSDPQFMENLNWPEKEKRALETRIMAHFAYLDKNNTEWKKADFRYEFARMGAQTEAARAERFINLANGEKSLIVFGQDHTRKEFDLDEAIMKLLLEDSWKKGTFGTLTKPEVIEIWENKNEMKKMQGFNQDSIHKKTQDPTARYFIETGEAQILPNDAYKFTTSPQQPVLQSAQHNQI